ncbi:MAG: hypothetical protein WBM41_13950 [Arenicellales bacterium]
MNRGDLVVRTPGATWAFEKHLSLINRSLSSFLGHFGFISFDGEQSGDVKGE